MSTLTLTSITSSDPVYTLLTICRRESYSFASIQGMVNQRPGAVLDILVGIPGDAHAIQASMLNHYLMCIEEAVYFCRHCCCALAVVVCSETLQHVLLSPCVNQFPLQRLLYAVSCYCQIVLPNCLCHTGNSVVQYAGLIHQTSSSSTLSVFIVTFSDCNAQKCCLLLISCLHSQACQDTFDQRHTKSLQSCSCTQAQAGTYES